MCPAAARTSRAARESMRALIRSPRREAAGCFVKRPRKTLHVASTPNVGQALDAGDVLSGEAAESPKRESSKEPLANAILQPGYAEGCPVDVCDRANTGHPRPPWRL